MPDYGPDFSRIRPINGDRRAGFEEFCAQLARHDDSPAGSRFVRLEGAGGDGGVECYWELADRTVWGYQSKFLDHLDKAQITASVETALRIHPNLTRYVVCLPFDLSGRTGRRGSDQQTRWTGFVGKWEQFAAVRGLIVSFEAWPKSELIERLVRIDPTGGRRRFWFFQEILSAEWFAAHIADAASDAGPRYHPELNVEVPISSQLGAFGETRAWKAGYARRLRKFGEEISRWRRATTDRKEGAGKERMEAAAPLLEAAHSELRGFLTADRINPRAIRDAVSCALYAVREAEGPLRDELEATHGEGTSSSASFRQFQAEYMVDFPAADLDQARDISVWLSEELEFLVSDVVDAIERRALLITGVAGAGKTHAICDAAKQRLTEGLLSIIVLGEKLNEGAVFEQIRGILGLPGDLSRDELLAALDAAAESSGSPLIIFVDALNERTPRDAWKNDLASFVNQVLRFRNLRVCLSCRSTYLDAVLPSELELPQVEHRGFAGVELTAILRFFAWWDLDPPAVPMLQPEFQNPLFLRMLCTGLSRSRRAEVTEPPASLREVVELLLETSEVEAEQRLDVDRRYRRVHAAVSATIEEMRRIGSLRLPWASAAQAVNALLPGRPQSQSLLDFLLREGILREVQTTSTGSADEVMFGFERLGEFLLGDTLVREIGTDGGLDRLFTTRDQIGAASGSAAGLNEALAILLPEAIGQELFDVDPEGRSEELLLTTVRSLAWRAPGSVSERTKDLLRQAIVTPRSRVPALDETFALAARVDHPLGTSFVDGLLGPLGQADRDRLLCPFLHVSWMEQGAAQRLSAWAVEPQLGRLTAGTALAWASALAWCCAAADRRPRDRATAGMVAVLERRSGAAAPLLDRFLRVNDDYIVERVLLAAYGALIRANNAESTKAAATVVYNLLFAGSPPLNALVRDHGRCIIELAVHRSAFPEIDLTRCLPPYGSSLPSCLVTSERARGMGDDAATELGGPRGTSERERLPKPSQDGPAWRSVWRSVDNDDFAIYTMTSALKTSRRERLDLSACKKWVLAEVERLGFDSRFDNYDRYMLHNFGGGRGRPTWAERVGKKYQWIALYRLIGLVADNVPLDPDRWEPGPPPKLPPALQAPGERNLDPTILVRSTATNPFAAAWWNPIALGLHPDLSPEEWLDRMDFPDTTGQIVLTGPDGTRWLTLQAYLDWDDRLDRTDYDVARRRCWVHLRSYLVAREDSERLWRWLRKQDFHGRWMPEGPHWLSYVFAGEYPWATQALHNITTGESYRDDKVPVPMLATVYDQSLEFDFDSYHEETINMLVPAPQMLSCGELLLDGASGHRNADGTLRFVAPDLTEPGPQALLAERDSFLKWLDDNGLAIVWTTLSEMHWSPPGLGGGHNLGYAVHSRAHRVVDAAVKKSRGITRRIRPSADATK
jgi:hypothetical protein